MSEIPDDFDRFHNTDAKVSAREIMLTGQWPTGGCEYCKNIEDSGGISDRLFQNQIEDVYPSELDQDPTLSQVNPVVLDVYFSNTCNLCCVYCNAKSSSKIQAEEEKYGSGVDASKPIYIVNQRPEREDLVDKFWAWFETHGQSLRRLQILGGEPFLQPNFARLIQHYQQYPNPDIEFTFVTNLTLPPQTILAHTQALSQLQRSRHVKRVDIQCSLDGWGPEHSYIRTGLDLGVFEENLNTLMGFGNFRVGILSTITSLSLPSMAALANKINAWSERQKIFWYMHLVLPNNTSVFDPTMFDYSVFEPHIDAVYQALPRSTWDDQTTHQVFDGIMTKLQKNCSTDLARQRLLLDCLNEVDRRRSLDWKSNFPWLEKIFRDNHVI